MSTQCLDTSAGHKCWTTAFVTIVLRDLKVILYHQREKVNGLLSHYMQLPLYQVSADDIKGNLVKLQGPYQGLRLTHEQSEVSNKNL